MMSWWHHDREGGVVACDGEVLLHDCLRGDVLQPRGLLPCLALEAGHATRRFRFSAWAAGRNRYASTSETSVLSGDFSAQSFLSVSS